MRSKFTPANPKALDRGGAIKMFAVSASPSGQVMLLICVAVFALMGMIAVVADFSFLQHQRNMMQTAADSAAMAGAEELNYGDQVAAGKADAGSNGYTDGASSVTVAISGYGAITLVGNATVNLNAPTTGPLAGILFFQDRSIPGSAAGSTITGNSSSTFDGAIYFPTTTLSFGGNSSVTGYSIVVANQLSVSGNSSIGTNYSSLTGGSPIKGTVLAE